jgi:hypothetical protein
MPRLVLLFRQLAVDPAVGVALLLLLLSLLLMLPAPNPVSVRAGRLIGRRGSALLPILGHGSPPGASKTE